MSTDLYFLIEQQPCVVRNQSLSTSYLDLKLVLHNQIDLKKTESSKSSNAVIANLLLKSKLNSLNSKISLIKRIFDISLLLNQEKYKPKYDSEMISTGMLLS